VDIDLLVRDICRLRPGLEGVSETVDVYSVVGRFLEHSRIFYFEHGSAVNGDDGGGDGDARPEYYIGSADWMTRNLDNRVEAVTPVEDPTLREQLRFVLELTLADNRRVWKMNPDGSYTQRTPGDERVIDTQTVLMGEARAAAEREDVTRGLPCEFELPGTGLRIGGEPADGGEQPTPEASANGAGVTVDAPEADRETDGGDGGLPELLETHRDRWYRPDSATYAYAVRTPEGGREYRKTAEGAASVIERYWT
jgi:polyphosphate kinase